jgi:hypothetical protein
MNKKIIALIIVILTGISWYFFFAPGDTNAFLAAYNIYDTASTAEEISARVPGVGENVSRQKLNEILSRVLTADMTPEERQKLSEGGLVLVALLRTEIDTIVEGSKKTETALKTLRLSSKKVGGFSATRKAGSIVALTEERAQVIQNVAEISYGINDQLESIFQGIITDRGALTPVRISALNESLPEAEKQFDRLTENYRKLDTLEKQIDREFGDFQKSSVKRN